MILEIMEDFIIMRTTISIPEFDQSTQSGLQYCYTEVSVPYELHMVVGYFFREMFSPGCIESLNMLGLPAYNEAHKKHQNLY